MLVPTSVYHCLFLCRIPISLLQSLSSAQNQNFGQQLRIGSIFSDQLAAQHWMSDLPFSTMDVSSLTRQYIKISSIWEGSLQKLALVTTIQRKLLNSEILQIDSAMCLGLENMESARPSLEALPMDMNVCTTSEVPYSWESEVSSDDESNTTAEPHDRLNTTRINPLLYQLIIFETAIEFLREKFVFKNIYFQDPWFSKADVEFLEQKGYTVILYSFTPVGTENTHLSTLLC